MPVKLVSAGGGGVILQPASSIGSDVVIETPVTPQRLIGNKTPGAVLQVVSVNKTDTTSTTSGSFVDVAGLSLSITPLSTASKMLVIAAFQWGHNGDDVGHSYLNIVRDSTVVVPATNISSSSGANIVGNFLDRQMLTGTIVAYDAPASVSALTYKLQWRTTAGTLYLNRSGRDANNASYDGRATSSLTVLEIAA